MSSHKPLQQCVGQRAGPKKVLDIQSLIGPLVTSIKPKRMQVYAAAGMDGVKVERMHAMQSEEANAMHSHSAAATDSQINKQHLHLAISTAAAAMPWKDTRA